VENYDEKLHPIDWLYRSFEDTFCIKARISRALSSYIMISDYPDWLILHIAHAVCATGISCRGLWNKQQLDAEQLSTKLGDCLRSLNEQ